MREHCEPELSHVNSDGEAKMVNVCAKRPLRRLARAEGRIIVGEQVLRKLHNLKKGDVLTVAKVAGLMGAKLTSTLIPMCHQIPLENIAIDIRVCEKSESLIVSSLVEANHKTGVEMESLTAVTITLLTLYDMCKSVNKSMIISGVRLLSKVKAEGS